MSDQDHNNEPALPFYRAPLGRGIINGVFLFCLLVGTQHFGLIEPGPPVTMENVTRFAVFGLVMAVIMYYWTGRRIKKDRARQEADRVARARADAYDSNENGDGDKDRSEK